MHELDRLDGDVRQAGIGEQPGERVLIRELEERRPIGDVERSVREGQRLGVAGAEVDLGMAAPGELSEPAQQPQFAS